MKTIQDYIDQHTPLYTQNEVNVLLEALMKISMDNHLEGCHYFANYYLENWVDKNKQ